MTTINNCELVIQANAERVGDWEKVKEVAQKMVEVGYVEMVISSADEWEQWVHLTACWDNCQAKEIRDAYKVAKTTI